MKMVPFIDVQVIAGANSDPTKLGFDYSIEFVDSKTIEIKLNWQEAAYVSANQPEEILLVKINGPIFDR